MKHAILVTAYKNLDQLVSLINYFDDRFYFYIHIDKKSSFIKGQIEQLQCLPNVKYLSRKYKVYWGGNNHLKSILHLACKAAEDTEVSYLHLISGQDFPIQSPDYFISFFEANNGKQFMEHFPLPAPQWTDGGMDRLVFYNPYDLFDGKKNKHRFERFLSVQKKMGIRRGFSEGFPILFGGSTWWSLSKDCVQHLVNYTRVHKDVLRRFKYSFCSEEIYIQTVIMNSKFKDTVINDNLRYIDWEGRNGNMPSILDESDYFRIMISKKLFARKFEFPVSMNLYRRLHSQSAHK